MSLNVLSRQGVIIGAIFTLLCSLGAVSKILRVYRILTPDSDNHMFMYPEGMLVEEIIIMIVTLVFAILSIIMILGVFKKRFLLVLPWLVSAFLLAGYITSMVFYNTLKRSRFYFDDCLFLVVVMGVEIIVMCPICQLVLQLRAANAPNRYYSK